MAEQIGAGLAEAGPGEHALLQRRHAATVTYQYPADTGTPVALPIYGDLRYVQLTADNSTASVATSVKVTGVKNNVGPAGEDAVTEITRAVFLPKTPENFTYDADGNLTQDGKWAYTWDGENRLIAMETATAAVTTGVAKQKLEFAYDAQGRRVSKKVYSWSGTGWVLGTSTHFLYDGWNLLADLNALNSNAVVCSYVWGSDLSGSMQGAGGVGGLLFAQTLDPSTQTLKPHGAVFDGNGNVIGYVDMATGAKSATYDYNAFGETIIADGPAAALFPFRFSTKYTDSETGLRYYGLRYYSPSTGRWVNRDPIAESGGLNLYFAAENDVINRIDALGLQVEPFNRTTIAKRRVDALGHVPGMPGKTVAGLTTPTTTLRWVRRHRINDCCEEILVDATLAITIRTVGDMADVRERPDGPTVMEHEMTHVDQIEQAWNAYAKVANALQGKWCGSGCADRAIAVESAAYALYEAQVGYSGQAFDSTEYGKPWGGEEEKFAAAFAKLAIEAGKLISSCPR